MSAEDRSAACTCPQAGRDPGCPTHGSFAGDPTGGLSNLPARAESSAARGYSLIEAKALHELGVRNHGWYMTEAEHRGVLDVLERLEAALREIADHDYLDGDECRRIAKEAVT